MVSIPHQTPVLGDNICPHSNTAGLTGYDGSLMGSINAVPEYQQYYDFGPNGATATGLVFSIFQIGQMIAALFLWVSDWRGRRLAMFVGCLGVIVATVITSVAPNLSTFIGGRFLLSFFAMIAYTSGPLYLVEIAPPMYRGTVAGVFNTLWYMGSIIATFAVYGANLHLSGNLKWRLPLWLQMVCPALVCIGVFFIPESPRWYVICFTNAAPTEARMRIDQHCAGSLVRVEFPRPEKL